MNMCAMRLHGQRSTHIAALTRPALKAGLAAHSGALGHMHGSLPCCCGQRCLSCLRLSWRWHGFALLHACNPTMQHACQWPNDASSIKVTVCHQSLAYCTHGQEHPGC